MVMFEPPAQTSNENETWGAMPNVHVSVVSDRDGWLADTTHVQPVRRMPLLGSRGWGAAIAWLGSVGKIQPVSPPDVVASLELFTVSTLQAQGFAREHGATHVIYVAETIATNPIYRYPPWSLIARWATPRIDGFVCISDLARTHLLERGVPADRILRVSMGVDTELFSPAPEGLCSAPRLAFVGALRGDRGCDKGILDICEAFHRIDQPDAELHVFGEGPLRPEVEAWSRRDPRIRLRDKVPRAALAEELRSMRAFVLASKRTWKWEEQFGFALVEAMATGLPIVATRNGAIPEVVPPHNQLVDEGDIDGLRQGMQIALGSEAEAIGAQNRTHAVNEFSAPTQARILGELLRSFIATRTPQR